MAGGSFPCGLENAQIGVPAVVFAGNGNNTLSAAGSTATDVLVGGAGNNLLTGGTGRNILIAGSGTSTLMGGTGQDILIGGTTDFDHNLTALYGLMAKWGRVDFSYAIRVNLTGSLPGGLNGSFFLNARTVHGNANADILIGGLGSDWFLSDLIVFRDIDPFFTDEGRARLRVRGQEGEESGPRFGIKRGAVFGDFESLDIFHSAAAFGTVRPHKQIPVTVRHGTDASADAFPQPAATLRLSDRYLVGIARVIGQPFVKLRLMTVQHCYQPIELRADIHDHMRLKGARLLEGIGEV
jgi:RTX calcium-binding nonapeptide repeat (4 copies)